MPSTTFNNLSTAKKQNIKRALLNEFSHYTLADAQVARIVSDAGVARGTFYKYFTDLIDAYRWLLTSVMDELHLHPGKLVRGQGKAADYQNAVEELVTRMQQGPYWEFLRMYYETNEGFLAAQDIDHKPTIEVDGKQWAIMVLSHQAIKECLMDGNEHSAIITRLGEALQKIIGG